MTDEEKKQLHMQTILNHIKYVKDMCYKLGIPELGKQHDLSKFSDEEFEIYKYADGTKSPHDIARAELGYSPSWIHHKARNQHHWEYWTDFNSAKPNGDGTFTIICKAVKMPYDRVIEMLADFVGAGKAYNPGAWNTHMPWDYWVAKCDGDRAMHRDSEYLFKKLLWNLHEHETEDDFIEWYNRSKEYLKQKYESGEIDY